VECQVQKGLVFLSPKHWIGIHQELSKSSIFDDSSVAPSFFTWILHLFLPLLILTLVSTSNTDGGSGSLLPFSKSYSNQIRSGFQNALKVTTLSPLAITTALQSQTKRRMERFIGLRKLRNEADVDAKLALANGIICRESLRCDGFDVFYPPCPKDDDVEQARNGNTPKKSDKEAKLSLVEDTKNDKNPRQKTPTKTNGMIIIPGYMVDHTAYAAIASRLAREGNMIIVILALDPLRIPEEMLGASLEDIVGLMKEVKALWKKELVQRRQSSDIVDRQLEEINWSIGGHSHGGYTAMKLAPQLESYLKPTNKLKAVAWGIGGLFINLMIDLSNTTNIDTLVINGSNDNIVSISENENLKKLKSKLSPTPCSKCVIIEGGNHNNFCSYSPSEASISFCGEPGITRENQHEIVSRKTVQFLQSN